MRPKMTLLQKIRRFFRARTLIVALDADHWAIKVPEKAVLLAATRRGPIEFASFDVSDCGNANVEFILMAPPPTGDAPAEIPIEGPQVLFDREGKS